MASFKVVISDPKVGKTVQKEVKDDAAGRFLGLKIGDKVRGELLDLSGYEFEITGGSDSAGFPMRRDLEGMLRKRILAVSGVGINPLKKRRRKGKVAQRFPGARQRKTVCGNTIHPKIVQINVKVLTSGAAPLFEAKEAAASEEKKQ